MTSHHTSPNARRTRPASHALYDAWINVLQDAPCAAYVLKNDPDLTLLGGNAAFYTMLGCNSDEMRTHYGNRLGALLDADSLQALTTALQSVPQSAAPSTPLRLKLRFKVREAHVWMDTEVRHVNSSNGPLLRCFGHDVTAYENTQRRIRQSKMSLRLAIGQLGLDYFEYDVLSGTARILSGLVVLPPIPIDEHGHCTYFAERLIAENFVCAEEVETFRQAFRDVGKGAGKTVCEFAAQRPGSEPLWVRLTLTTCQDGQGLLAAGTMEDISAQKEAARNYLNETQFFQAILKEKDAYAQVDVTLDKITRIGGMWNLYNEIIHKVSYSQLTHEFIHKIVHPEDRQHYLEVMQRDNFMQSFHNGIDQLGCQFRRIVDQNKMVWMQLNVHLILDPLTHHVLALLTIKNIHEQKQHELRLQRQASQSQQAEAAALAALTSPAGPAASPVTAAPHLPHPAAENTTTLANLSFDAFLGEQGDIAYLVDPDTFDLICGNNAFYDRLGINEMQCAGVKCYEVMHKRETPCPFCSKANWSTDKFYLWKNLNATLEQEFLIKNKLVPWRGREMLLAVAVDISNNKSIVDSMNSGSEELHAILSGVQHMTDATSLVAAMRSALETIGFFFLASTVRFWQRDSQGTYACAQTWACGKEAPGDLGTREGCGTREVNAWLQSRTWAQPIMLENPEAMLCHSYDMYRYMKSRHINNQRWLQVRQRDEELGCISIDNITSNFLNNAFLESFTVFMAAELKKRQFMENALHADRHDPLTDLFTRKSFERYIGEYQPDEMASLGTVISNFNNLKAINAAHGFQAGNYFIRQFADMFREVFVGHPVFRLNGDEFLAIVPEVTRTELDAKLNELERRMAENGAFSVSMGGAWDDVEKDMATLIEEATAAMKVNKKRHYDATPASYGAERRRMLSDLIAALENREYEIYLQPKVELAHASVVGAEALIRYHDKDLGLLPPAHFIDRLEKNNLIRYIDLFVFEEVCKLLEKWQQQSLALPVVSLNFSRLTLLERDMLASVEDIIYRYNAPRSHIEIEITESVADMGKSVIYQAACGLYKAGFGISLDDFGTKYTNLSMLADLDFSKLKLDRSLTSRLGDRMHTLIMKNIIRMCAELGIEVVAEGIETKQQEHILRELQCRMGQGYLYGKPVPVAEFERKYLQALPPQLAV